MKYIYPIKPFQTRILNDLSVLKTPTYNFVMNQKHNRPNLTINQMNRSIYRSVRNLIKDFLGTKYTEKIENEYVKYYCLYETLGTFSKSQRYLFNDDMDVTLGIHFHLFISPMKPDIPMTSFSYYLYDELTSFKHKKTCINRFDHKVYDVLPLDFILYHTKQYVDYPIGMIFSNY